MSDRTKIVYLSGRITGNENYKKDFSVAEEYLHRLGYIVVSPARLDELSSDKLSYEQYMKVCYSLIDISDIIFMVSGWQDSKGARAELIYAKSIGKEVKYQDYYSPWRKGQLIVIPNVGDESIIDDAPFRKVNDDENS